MFERVSVPCVVSGKSTDTVPCPVWVSTWAPKSAGTATVMRPLRLGHLCGLAVAVERRQQQLGADRNHQLGPVAQQSDAGFGHSRVLHNTSYGTPPRWNCWRTAWTAR